MAAQVLRLSISRAQKLRTCSKAYEYSYERKLASESTSVSLVFGDALHVACTGFVAATVRKGMFDPHLAFDETFQRSISQAAVSYPVKWTEGDFLDTGHALIDKFITWWTDGGYTPLLDSKGVPWVERGLEASLGGRGAIPGFPQWEVILNGEVDFIAMSPEGKVLLIDLKTTTAAYHEVFALTSDQLTMYDILIRANREQFDFETVDGLMFAEAIRAKVPDQKSNRAKGEGPRIVLSDIALPRSDEVRSEFLNSMLWAAEDILRKRFARQSMGGYNTPCDMCEFSTLCTTGDATGLIKKPDRRAKPVALSA